MVTLNELIAQKAALEKEIEARRTQEREDAIARVRALMNEHGLTLADIGARASSRSRAPSSTRGSKVPPKFRDPATGQTWSGRGLQPKWLKAAIASGRKLSDFAI